MFQIIGPIEAPLKNKYFNASAGQGLFLLLGNIFRLALAIGGIYMVFQFISAGYMYMSAIGDAKKLEAAWNKIWQSILGLIIIASAFVLASLVEKFTGLSILNFDIYGPGQ